MTKENLAAMEALMANERTMLAYATVAIFLISAGLGMTVFLSKTTLTPADYGALFIMLAGFFLALYGTYSYMSRRREILKKHRGLEKIPF